MNDIPASPPPAAVGDASRALDPLLSPYLDALFWRPSRLGVPSAWYGHVPFAHWITVAARPRSIVELGTHAGVSYAAFCEAVLRARLDARCLAVDTWEGDDHAGFYGPEIYRDLAEFHEARYAGFSTLLRATFDDALQTVADDSIDLLHIDGRHAYEDVRHDLQSWRPKLSSRAVVLLHDTNERERGFGVWRLWRELSGDLPHFEFLHEHGLGVLCIGRDPPAAVHALCGLSGDSAVGELRERFAMLGERWVLDTAHRRLERAVAEQRAHADALENKFCELEAYTKAIAGPERPPARAELRAARASALAARHDEQRARAAAAEAEARTALAEAKAQHVMEAAAAQTQAARAEAAAAQAVLDTMLGSRAWQVAQALRSARTALRPSRSAQPAPALPGPALHDGAPALAGDSIPLVAPVADQALRSPRVLFAAGEPGTPGCIYRCIRQADTARQAGWDARWKPIGEISADDLRETDLVVLWRVTWNGHVEGVIEHVHMFGGRVALDLDDLMIRLELAKVEYIDAIRSINWSEMHVRGMFSAVMQVLHRVDFCIATTDELASEMRRWQKAAYVLPNGFDARTFERSRLASRTRAIESSDGLVRIGYATGSRTHQRDFAEAAEAVAAVLRARESVRLVLFRSARDSEALLTVDEFSALDGLGDRIEWRELVELDELPNELARFDINIVPLQLDNPFVEAKSELKYFEAAIAGVPSVASPTGPYRRAIADGETGFLATGFDEWQAALLRLVDDPALRERMGRAACADVLWRFGPDGRAQSMRRFLSQQQGGLHSADGRALAAGFALAVGRAAQADRLPSFQASETLFLHDRLEQAEVTVVIASYNYADYIAQALETVRLQTMPVIDLVVADDRSTDPATMEQILDWAHLHAQRFNRLVVVRHQRNAGLGATRNTGFAFAETPYVLPLDADNLLLPECGERLLQVLRSSGAAFAYSRLRHFGADDRITGGERFEPQRLVGGNYIDAMALVARWAWAAAGGYYVQRDAMGWEDFSLWCRLAELGQWGEAVDEVLAEYRVHANSMVNAITERLDNKQAMVAFVERRHPWLKILAREPLTRQ